ncbi:LysR family transcriptional regulator [Amycolatopsis sulphurea]|uniref:LysR family transcriptional regulator n=1 Tax=Amycolatopsis sulphurea TaxID=76022 RepID=A0A2A9FCP2_9PSEU|nr:LysR substrate-binding domain-containing protein [Amycolatopsis sulphurea]PFG49197.1 LysR family transcriptional regulator [Amycolatopsis sulphurea]
MELRHLRYFLAVAEERNFTRAAERLTIAQSPLSQQIRQLERDLGVELFTRTTRSVALTYAGEVFLQRARALLTDAETAADDARKAAAGQLGSLSVGFTGSATYELLPTLVRAYADRYPDVTLEVHSDMVTPRQTEQLLDGRLSVGVLRPPVTVPGLAVETIRHEPVVAILASRHPATVHRSLDLADLRDEWFISYPSDPPSTMYSVMRSACETAGFTPRIRQTVADSAALVALVAADMGVALVPASLRHLHINGATFRPLATPALTTGLALAYQETDVSPLVRRFIDTARTVVRSRTAVETPTPPPPNGDEHYGIEF